MKQLQITLLRTVGAIESVLRIFVDITGVPSDHLHRTVEAFAATDYPGWILKEYHSV